MRWLLWRQHRTQTVWTAGLLGALGLLLAVTGVNMAHSFDHARTACRGTDSFCAPLSNLFDGKAFVIDLVHLTLALPLVLGIFFGAAIFARETENATNVLAWSQSVTRRQWLRSKLFVAIGATVVVSASVTALVTWWSGTLNSLHGDRFQGAQFDTQNIVPIAYALFAVALGLAAGAYFRRTLPAIATTVGGYVAVRLLVSVYARPHFFAVRTLVGLPDDRTNVPSGSWSTTANLVDAAGHTVNGPIRVPDGCVPAFDRPGKCLADAGYHTVTKFHPPSQYWPYQWVESAIYVGVAVALVAFAIVLMRRRDA